MEKATDSTLISPAYLKLYVQKTLEREFTRTDNIGTAQTKRHTNRRRLAHPRPRPRSRDAEITEDP